MKLFNVEMILDERAINNLAKSYNTLDYYITLVQHLRAIYPNEKFDNFPKYDLHKLLNQILLEYYNGEEILKYKLAEKHLKQRGVVGAFEMKVNKSRVDFLTVNGVTTSFEIKSELDNLSKFSKQASDYLLAFEYNYLVTDEKHLERAKDILPKGFGLSVYKDGKYRKLKSAQLNKSIDPEMQLRLLTKKEINKCYPGEEGKIRRIINNYSAKEINTLFKHALKDRYRNRWNFLYSNKESIFPVDIQFFFNTNILPDRIYHH